MNYALIKNIPLNTGIFSRNSKDKIEWKKYGFSIDGMRLAKQGYDANGDYLNILPIVDNAVFDAQLPALEAFVEASISPNDSIEKLTESAADIAKGTILPPVNAPE